MSPMWVVLPPVRTAACGVSFLFLSFSANWAVSPSHPTQSQPLISLSYLPSFPP